MRRTPKGALAVSESLRVLIVDDEPRARHLLRRLIETDPALEIVGECANGYEAIELVHSTRPDLMFLDVQMPELNGFDVLDRLDHLPAVVFVTAFDSHAIRAFEKNALDYLLKPFDKERFLVTLQRAKSEIGRKSAQPERLAALLDRMGKANDYLHRIAVKRNGRMFLIPTAEIECIEAEDNYVRISYGDTSYLLRETLGNLADKLDPKRFMRVHRCALMNIEKLEHAETGFHGQYHLVLSNGKQLTLSRTYRDNFFNTFGHPS